MGAASAMVFSNGLFSSPEEAVAFPNKVSNKFDDRPKQRGAKVSNHHQESRSLISRDKSSRCVFASQMNE